MDCDGVIFVSSIFIAGLAGFKVREFLTGSASLRLNRCGAQCLYVERPFDRELDCAAI